MGTFLSFLEPVRPGAVLFVSGNETFFWGGGLTGLERFAELIEAHKGTVFRTLARLVGQGDELEDLAQEVFLRLFRGLAQFRGEAKLSTWLYRITVNVAHDELRRRVEWRRGFSIDDPDGQWPDRLPAATMDPGEGMDREMFLGSLREAMEQLSLRDRAILTLYYQEERSYREISDILELPMGTVKTQIHRAKEHLKSRMKERMAVCRTTS